ncbi:MAG: glycoside hydrolase family 127 protein, partial [Sphaerochaeta sp.]|nr:glycoside hydrolase family 127 protein [Sphaerochaeta sp.]
QKTTYPWSGEVSISLDMEDNTPCNVFLRIPGWCDQWSVAVNTELQDDYRIESGYVVLKRVYSPHDTIRLTLQMPVKLVQSDSRVEQLSGKAAIMRGPLVYCLEEKDNGSNLHELVLDSNSEFDLKEESIESVPVVSILMDGYRETIRPDALYQTYQSHKRERIRIAAIPYFCWGNRSKDQEMRVWNRVM